MQPEMEVPSVEHRKQPSGDIERYRHPAYGMVRLQKTQAGGAGVELFGSQLQHKTLVKLRIETGFSDRELNRDWHRSEKLVAEMVMSEAQLAALITSPNGEGVPVTFTVRPEDGARLMLCPGIARTETPLQTFEREMLETCREYLATAQALTAALAECANEGKAGKGKLQVLLNQSQQLSDGLPKTMEFIQKQFSENMAKTIAAGKLDIEAYTSQVIRNAGLEALLGSAPKLIAEEKDRD